MSVLEIPRIFFKGALAWDPITTNNYDDFYDENTDAPVFSTEVDRVQAFRKNAIAAVTTKGNWNPHGTHRSLFYDSQISGVDLGAGTSIQDPFMASAAAFTGMLVDAEPYGALSSQLFFDSMRFGIDGGYRILCKRSARVTARYINFSRNPANAMIAGVASVVWQTSFAKTDGLRIDAFDSPALQALAAAIEADDVLGISVRFNTYRTVYYDALELTNRTPEARAAGQALIDKLQAGGFQPNPARSVLVGVIGLWRKGEPLHEPGDRALVPPAKIANVAAAHVRVSKTALTLDLANSIQETTRDLHKADLGVLSVVAVAAKTAEVIALGTLAYAQYNRQAYEASAGIVTLPLTAQQAAVAASQDIQLRDAQGNVLLGEVAVRALPLTPNLYIDEGATDTARFQIYERGAPAEGRRAVTVYELPANAEAPSQTYNYQSDDHGLVSFSVKGSAGGVVGYVPVVGNAAPAPSGGIDPQRYTYMYLRTLAADADVAALEPTWENVYTRVLANWNAMAPCMDNWLRLDDPDQVKAYASALKRLTDPANFESFLFMPVTRDMTQGERKLLYAFLDQPSTQVVATAAHTPSHAQLSRAMRRG
ncbi:MAG: hypothetical protein RL701_2697 [Pseudomonadota bacterium]